MPKKVGFAFCYRVPWSKLIEVVGTKLWKKIKTAEINLNSIEHTESMDGPEKEIGLIKKRFPLKCRTIELLFGTDPEFRSLCEDYFLCEQMLKKLDLEIDQLQSAKKDYQDTIGDLEKEIAQWIMREENKSLP
jgi:hypothetical protein